MSIFIFNLSSLTYIDFNYSIIHTEILISFLLCTDSNLFAVLLEKN